MENTYRQVLDKKVIPKLISLGFQEVRLKHCMCPEVLFRKGDLWFATSYDERDHYLDIKLGRLYWLSDVMPNASVVGDYGDFYRPLKSLSGRYGTSPQELEPIAEDIYQSLEQAISNRDKHPEHEAREIERLKDSILRPVKEDDLAVL